MYMCNLNRVNDGIKIDKIIKTAVHMNMYIMIAINGLIVNICVVCLFFFFKYRLIQIAAQLKYDRWKACWWYWVHARAWFYEKGSKKVTITDILFVIYDTCFPLWNDYVFEFFFRSVVRFGLSACTIQTGKLQIHTLNL